MNNQFIAVILAKRIMDNLLKKKAIIKMIFV